MDEPIPDDPKLQADLADRWARTLDFSPFDRPDEPGAWNLVYSLRHIQESCRALLDRRLPALVAASGREATRDALTDTGEELFHLAYHLRDARYFEPWMARADASQDESPRSG